MQRYLMTTVAMMTFSCMAPSLAQGATCTVPNSISNGQAADASAVMGNFEAVADCAEAAVTTTGAPTTGQISVFTGSQTVSGGNLSGDVTTSDGTATTLSNSGVTPGAYSSANIIVDAKGRVTSATNGTGSGSGFLLGQFVATGGETTATLSSLPQNFEHLQIIIVGNSSSGSDDGDLKMYANGDTNDAHYRDITWNRFGAGVQGYPRILSFQGVSVPEADAPSTARVMIYGYSHTDWKKNATSDSLYQDSPNFFRNTMDWFWKDTSAITSLTFTLRNSTFTTGTRIQIFGYGD